MQDSVRTITQAFAEQPRPQSLIVSVLGAFIRDLGGWIAVADLVRLLDDDGSCSRGESAGFATRRGAVRSGWALDVVEAGCENFIGLCEPILRTWKRRRPDAEAEAEAAFTDYIRALTHWRRLAFLDPGLP